MATLSALHTAQFLHEMCNLCFACVIVCHHWNFHCTSQILFGRQSWFVFCLVGILHPHANLFKCGRIDCAALWYRFTYKICPSVSITLSSTNIQLTSDYVSCNKVEIPILVPEKKYSHSRSNLKTGRFDNIDSAIQLSSSAV